MKATRNMITLVAATIMATAPALWAKSASDQPYQNEGAQNAIPGEKTRGTLKSVSIPTSEVVIAEIPGGAKNKHTLASSADLSDGRDSIAIEDLKPGQSVSFVEGANGEIVELTVLSPSKKG